MARGRMINNKIALDKRVHDLSDDTSRLAFTWLITFADCEGRTYGDPAVVRSMLFPRRSDMSVEQMEAYLSEWAEAGLVIWYEAEGDKWIEFPNFGKNQKGLDRRHEPKSIIPSSEERTDEPRTSPVQCTDDVQTSPVQCTAQENRTEQKRSRSRTEKRAAAVAKPPDELQKAATTTTTLSLLRDPPVQNGVAIAFAAYQQATARPITQMDVELLQMLVEEHGGQQVADAVREAASSGSWNGGTKYLAKILARWKRAGPSNGRAPLKVVGLNMRDPTGHIQDWTGVGQRSEGGR